MRPHSLTQTAPEPPATCTGFRCPLQVLVIDTPHGPADVLMNTLSRLMDRDISVMTLDDHTDALRALSDYHVDLVVIGLYADRPLQLALLPHIRGQLPARAILAVGRELSPRVRQAAQMYGADDVLEVPRRAADLKQLVRHVSQHHLRAEAPHIL